MAQPARPPGFEFANFHSEGHLPTTLPPEIDLSPQVAALLGGQSGEHLPDVVLPDAANHMSTVGHDHLPDWLLS